MLIVDDSRSSAKMICAVLNELGYDASFVTSGVAAWQRLEREQFDVLLTDWVMPGVDGIELCRRVRTTNSNGYTYIIIMTGRPNGEDRAMGLAAGADDYLTKPVDPAELSARLTVASRITELQLDLNARTDRACGTLSIMEEANYRFEELFRSLPIACVTLDSRGIIQDWNHASEELFGLRADQALQKPIAQLLYHSEPAEKVSERIKRVFAGDASRNVEWIFPHPDGTSRVLERSQIPMYGKNNTVIGCMCAHVDITERKSLEARLNEQLRISQQLNVTLDAQRRALEASNQQLSELALKDPLTGLLNRRHLMTTLDKCCAYSIRHQKPLSVLMIDVDYFKNYNDDFGHLAGDEILKVVATTITHCVRREDSVGRYGGEEFLVIMPAAPAVGAKVVAERLQSLLHQHTWVEREVCVSVGIASLSDETPTAVSLLDLADQALYKAKRAGRNAIVIAQHLDPDVWRAA